MSEFGHITISVVLITYNHEKYISQAIESILMQDTTFDFKIIIGDDFSTDRTREIVLMYQQKYIEKIEVIFSPTHQGPMANVVNTFTASNGKYIAVLEGDDYWIDSKKLSKQVEFLENHPEFSMCFTDRIFVTEENNLVVKNGLPQSKRQHLTYKEVLSGFTPPTQTVIFRSEYIKNTEFLQKYSTVYNGDTFLFSYLSTKGNVGYLDFISAAYRINTGRYSNSGYFNRLVNKANTYNTLRSIIPVNTYKFLNKAERVVHQRLFVLSIKEKKYKTTIKSAGLLIKNDFKHFTCNFLIALKLLITTYLKNDLIITD